MFQGMSHLTVIATNRMDKINLRGLYYLHFEPLSMVEPVLNAET